MQLGGGGNVSNELQDSEPENPLSNTVVYTRIMDDFVLVPRDEEGENGTGEADGDAPNALKVEVEEEREREEEVLQEEEKNKNKEIDDDEEKEEAEEKVETEETEAEAGPSAASVVCISDAQDLEVIDLTGSDVTDSEPTNPSAPVPEAALHALPSAPVLCSSEVLRNADVVVEADDEVMPEKSSDACGAMSQRTTDSPPRAKREELMLGSVLNHPVAPEEPTSLHMSRCHPELAKRIRGHIMQNLVVVEGGDDEDSVWHILRAAPQWTFVLPDMSNLPAGVQEWIEADLFQKSHQKALEAITPPVINWHPELSPLKPLFTAGDGNCLLHAVSLGMYGVHDRELALRQALFATLTADRTAAIFKQRWKLKAAEIDMGAGKASEEALEKQWAGLVLESSTKAHRAPGSGKARFEYLSQFHIFVLAHILRRPIIVYADRYVRDADTQEVVYQLPEAERIDGIYLPVLWPQEASRSDPLALCFHQSHFAPLVATAKNSAVSPAGSVVVAEGEEEHTPAELTAVLPLMDSTLYLLPVHYLSPEEEERKVEVLSTWLSVSSTSNEILVAKQHHPDISDVSKVLIKQYIARASRKVEEKAKEEERLATPVPCRGGCGFTGTAQTANFCSVCYRRHKRQVLRQAARKPQASPAPMTMTTEDKPLCRGKCGFYGDARSGGYCSVCVKAMRLLKQAHINTVKLQEEKAKAVREQQERAGAPVPCRTRGCDFHGTKKQQNYCSVCYEKHRRRFLF